MRERLRDTVLLSLIIVALLVDRPKAAERLEGPVGGFATRVVDGDTIEVRARIWLGQEVTTRVRLDGVDAPEVRGHCQRERRLAELASAFVAERLGLKTGGKAPVRLRHVRYGKYAGRVLARIETAGGEDLGTALLEAGLARPYGDAQGEPWCAPTPPGERRPDLARSP